MSRGSINAVLLVLVAVLVAGGVTAWAAGAFDATRAEGESGKTAPAARDDAVVADPVSAGSAGDGCCPFSGTPATAAGEAEGRSGCPGMSADDDSCSGDCGGEKGDCSCEDSSGKAKDGCRGTCGGEKGDCSCEDCPDGGCGGEKGDGACEDCPDGGCEDCPGKAKDDCCGDCGGSCGGDR